ncbi:MAG: hypothetical protein WC284_12995 [Candidimonas sp.]
MTMAAVSPLVGGIVNSALAEQNKKITTLADTFIPTAEWNTNSIPYIRVMHNPIKNLHFSITREKAIPIKSIDAVEFDILNRPWELRDVFSMSKKYDYADTPYRALMHMLIRLGNRVAYQSRRGAANKYVLHPNNEYLFHIKPYEHESIKDYLNSCGVEIYLSRNCPKNKIVAFYAKTNGPNVDAPFCFNQIDRHIYYSEISHYAEIHSNIEKYVGELKLDV